MTTDNDVDNDVFFIMSGQRTEYADRPCSQSVLTGHRRHRLTLSNFGSPPADPWGD